MLKDLALSVTIVLAAWLVVDLTLGMIGFYRAVRDLFDEYDRSGQ